MRIPAPAFTERDLRHLERTFADILDCIEEDRASHYLHQYDRTVRTSQGYVEVQHDGCVVHYGHIVMNLDIDGDEIDCIE